MTGFEPANSTSRIQIACRLTRANTQVRPDVMSAGVRASSASSATVVTQFVAHPSPLKVLAGRSPPLRRVRCTRLAFGGAAPCRRRSGDLLIASESRHCSNQGKPADHWAYDGNAHPGVCRRVRTDCHPVVTQPCPFPGLHTTLVRVIFFARGLKVRILSTYCEPRER